MFYKQAYKDVTKAEKDASLAINFFQNHYGVKEDNTRHLHDETYSKCEQLYSGLDNHLYNYKHRSLYVHVLIGHGALKDGYQSLLINEPEKIGGGAYYKRLEVIKTIKGLAEKYPLAYHWVIFDCCV